jgi:M6 family metalloprotease-like protein
MYYLLISIIFFLSLLHGSISYSQPNLTPYKPTGWSDKIVVSKTTGTNTDSSPLYTTDTLYVDWGVINNGTGATSATFYTKLYVDGVERYSWYKDTPLNVNYYIYVTDYSIGTLSVGTHTIKIVTDTTGVISESNESDNEYTKTITVTASTQPNLTPYKPPGWSDKIVVSNATGTNTDSSPLYTTDTLYVDWAVINNGTGATAASFYTKLYVDGVEKQSWYTSPPMEVNYYAFVTDYSIGTLSAGTHTIKIVADSTGVISESNESDNEYTKTITVTASTQPNLTPYKPTSWSGKIVVSNVTGTNTDNSPLYIIDTLYVDWAVINDSDVSISSRFYTALYVDGVLKNSWYWDSLNPHSYVNVNDYSIGSLSAGTHTVKIVADSTGVISESNESDNEYTKTITVISEGVTLKKALVLLIDFSNKPGEVPRDSFQDLLFGTNPSVAPKGSFKDYYSEVSYGKLQIEGQVNDATISWIRLPQSSTYYAGGCYGTNSSDCVAVYPQNAQKMVEDAVVAAKNLGLDFGPYDTDGDGIVDTLFVVHSGRGGERSGNKNDIWSHAWATRTPIDTGSKNSLGQSVYVYSYSTEPEYWDSIGDMTIGVYAHEFGHILELPDLYDTDDSSSGVGRWSLMAGGSWNGILGDTPAHLDAWSKYFLGWITPIKVTGTLLNEPIEQAETSQDIYQLLDGSPITRSGDYFLVENRQQVNFDEGLPSSGLLIWHIDESKATTNNTDNAHECYPGGPTCTTSHYRVALVQADNYWDLEKGYNRGDEGDPFPGTCYVISHCNTSFDSTTSPNSNLYNGNPSGVSITNISASGSIMSATLSTGQVGSIFSDVPSDYWAYDYIIAIYNNHITTGCSQNPLKYCPDTLVSRDQMAAFLVRAKEGEPASTYCSTGSLFSDVDANHWACKYIKRLYELGITTGCAQNPLRYCPDTVVSRDQMAAFLVRAKEGEPAANYCSTGSPFSDVDTNHWACKYIKRLYELGITTGCAQNPLRYCPSNIVPRDQMAAFLARAFLGME